MEGLVTRKRGLIIIGYQGIGKTTHSGKDDCIDLESSNFYLNGKRPEKWWIYYCKIALSLANQGYTVFISSHKEVRNYLYTASLPENVGKICVFCPTKLMRDEWIQRLEQRYERTKLNKDYRALMNAKERYEENIIELVSESSEHGIPVYQPSAMDYDLDAYIYLMRKKYC